MGVAKRRHAARRRTGAPVRAFRFFLLPVHLFPAPLLTKASLSSHSFDHQMVIHTATSRLFVFGGKNQPFAPGASASLGFLGRAYDPSASLLTDATRSRYSGMWCYHLDTRKWTHLL